MCNVTLSSCSSTRYLGTCSCSSCSSCSAFRAACSLALSFGIELSHLGGEQLEHILSLFYCLFIRLPPGILSFGACVATGGPILPEIYSPTFVEKIEQLVESVVAYDGVDCGSCRDSRSSSALRQYRLDFTSLYTFAPLPELSLKFHYHFVLGG